MEKVINLGIPHVSEQIFDSIETEELIEYLKISQTFKETGEGTQSISALSYQVNSNTIYLRSIKPFC